MWTSVGRYGMGALALSCGIGTAVSALPQSYGVLASQSNASVSTTIQAGVDLNPDVTELVPGGNDFPMFGSMQAASNTQPTTDSTATAEVGLPGQFDVANGITFSQLSIVLGQLPGQLEGFGLIPVPLDLTGSNTQLAAAFVYVSSFRIDLDAPFSSSLTPTGNLNEWLWAGVANATISGTLHPLIQIPTQGDVPGGSYPFSQQVVLPLAGTFSGDNHSTRIAVGLQQGALQDQDLSQPPITEQVPVLDLPPVGPVNLLLNLREFTLADISTAVVYEAPVPIPEPSTALLLTLGLVGIAWRRRP
jgi:PEP-CTERM motif